MRRSYKRQLPADRAGQQQAAGTTANRQVVQVDDTHVEEQEELRKVRSHSEGRPKAHSTKMAKPPHCTRRRSQRRNPKLSQRIDIKARGKVPYLARSTCSYPLEAG